MRCVILALLVGAATSQYTGECNRNPPTTTDACLAAILRGGTAGGTVFNDIFKTTAGLNGQQLYWTGKLYNTGCGLICAGCQPGLSLPPYDCPGQYTCSSVAGGCPYQVNANGANNLDRYWVHPCRTTQHAPAGQCPIGSCLADGDASGYFPWEGFIFDLGNKCNNVAIFAENDHGPQPCESIEYTVFLTNNPASRDVLFPLTYADSDPNKWNRATLKRVYTKGWVEVRGFTGASARPACGDTAQFGVEEDSMVPVYGLPSGTVFRYAAIVAGNDGKDFPECAYHSNEAELDAVAGLTEGFDAICPDLDGDGKDACSCPSPMLDKQNCDCNDNDKRIFMGAVEPCDATFDWDCDGKFPTVCTGGATCVNSACKADCLVSNWSPWTTTCSLYCGGGVFSRTRTITQPRQGAGAACPDLIETQPCNTRPCVPCTGLTNSPDGTWLSSCGAPQLADGDKCSIVCLSGYSLTPAGSERLCDNGVLTGTNQQCVGQPCNANTLTIPPLGEANTCTGTIQHNAFCSIRCLPGSTLVGPPSRQCVGAVFSGAAQDCLADCPAYPFAAPTNGNLDTCNVQSAKSGDTCSYACDSSYAVTGNPMRCTNGQWTGTPQTCVLVQPGACQGFTYPPMNGDLGNCTGIIPNHATCQYSCYPGYTLLGNPITCNDAVLDDRLQTSCWPKNCTSLLPPANGDYGTCTLPMAHGARCNIVCDAGFQRQGVSQGCALGNITYSQTCVESPCNAPLKLGSFVTNGNLGNCTGTIAAGALCSFACDAGFRPSSPGRVCARGDFQGAAQTCDKITIPCPALRSAPYNGNIGNCGTQINDGDYCSFQCDTGYTLSAGTRQCVLGVLSQPAQACRPDNCAALGGSESPDQGSTGTCGQPILHGDYCNFECNDNVTFALVGPHRQCFAGVLLGAPQTCVALAATDCRPLNVVPPKGDLGDCGAKLANGQNCSITCDNNYFLKPDNSSRFCNNGVLEGPTQWCEAEMETPPPTNVQAPTPATRVPTPPTMAPTAAIGVTVTITFTKPLTPDELPTLVKEITTALGVPINRIYVVSHNGTEVVLGFMPPSPPGGESATDLATRFLNEWDKIKNGTGSIPGVVIKDLDTNSTRPATVTSALTPVECADGSLAASQSMCPSGTAPSPSAAKAAFPVGAVVGGVVGGLAFLGLAALLIFCCRKGGKRAGAVEMA